MSRSEPTGTRGWPRPPPRSPPPPRLAPPESDPRHGSPGTTAASRLRLASTRTATRDLPARPSLARLRRSRETVQSLPSPLRLSQQRHYGGVVPAADAPSDPGVAPAEITQGLRHDPARGDVLQVSVRPADGLGVVAQFPAHPGHREPVRLGLLASGASVVLSHGDCGDGHPTTSPVSPGSSISQIPYTGTAQAAVRADAMTT